MICGGNYNTATAAKQGQGVVATDICASINPEDSAPTWVYEKMPSVRWGAGRGVERTRIGKMHGLPKCRVKNRLSHADMCRSLVLSLRVMTDAVLLVDDVILIINGAQKGFEGLKPTYASVSTRVPHLYNTAAPVGKR